MLDPVAWLWSFADHEHSAFDERSMRAILDHGFDRLVAANFVIQTTNAEFVHCPSCPDGHEEEVVVLDWPDGRPRYFVSCPENLRVEVPPRLLERWTIDWNALARSTAKALALGGECTKLIADRLWRLGRLKWKGTYRDTLFVRGFSWPDGRAIAQQVSHATRPIAFVGDIPPPDDAWAGRAPPVVRMSQVVSFGDGKAEIDYDAVLAAIVLADIDDSSDKGIGTDAAKLKMMIRQQIKAEGKTQLTDDVLLAAYQQEGSVRKASAFLSETTGQAVTKDKVQNALRRSGGHRTRSATVWP